MLESLFNNVAGLKVCIFIKKETPTQLFSCEYCEILKSTFSYRAPVDFGYKIDIFRILCVIAFFPFVTLLESVFHGYSTFVSKL